MMELGATVCLPQRPLCLHCPVQQFCTTRGEHPAPPPKKMRNRQIAYALLRRHRAGAVQVMLELRPLSASLMPGMWELPEVAMLESDEDRVEITLRHAITVTNYQVRVLRFAEQEAQLRIPSGENRRQWTRSSELCTLPLTGLTRKVLRRLEIIPKEVR
jgi:A/G-specific adenine glycosylase